MEVFACQYAASHKSAGTIHITHSHSSIEQGVATTSWTWNLEVKSLQFHVPAEFFKVAAEFVGAGPMPTATIILLVFTARCTLVQRAVLRSHVVCLSVCLSVCNVGEL